MAGVKDIYDMGTERLKVSILFGAGATNPALPELLQKVGNARFYKQAKDPETFLAQHRDTPPELVLVDLNGLTRVPDWLEGLIDQLPQSEVAVCSETRDPDFLIRIMKLRVGAFLPLPLNLKDLEDALERVRVERSKLKVYRGQLVAVTGTKGGVGTTSVATNLAVALAEQLSGGVVLVDMARPFPQVGQFLDLKGSHTVMDLAASADALDPMFIQKVVQKHKSQLDVLMSNPEFGLEGETSPNPGDLGKIFTGPLRQLYEWVVVDCGAWVDRFYIWLMQEADQILLLTELTVPDLQNLKRIKSLLHSWDVDEHKVRVVVNRYEKDYTLGLKDIENIAQQPAFYTLPSDYLALSEAINQGVPLVEAAPRSKLWRRLKALAGELIVLSKPKAAQAHASGRGFFRRIFHKG